MILKTRRKVLALTEKQEKQFFQRQEISHELSALERRIKELKEDRRKIDKRLCTAFDPGDHRRMLKDGTIVERVVIEIPERIVTEEMVGDVIQSGYSYPRYSEIAS